MIVSSNSLYPLNILPSTQTHSKNDRITPIGCKKQTGLGQKKIDEINEVKRAIGHENWKRMYEEYKNSGMTVKNWCEAQEISVKTFYYRLRVLCENLFRENETHEIVPISACEDNLLVGGSSTSNDRIHISGNGIEVELPMSVSRELITAILQGIRSC